METTPSHLTHVAILPSPGMGHLIPLVEFAKRLILHDNISVTFIIPTDGPPPTVVKSTLDSLPTTAINSIFLPPVALDDLPEGVKIETVISVMVVRSLPSLRDVFKSLSPTALVVDLFGTDAFDVAKEFNVSPFIFFPSTAMALSLFLYLPKLDEETGSCEYRDLPEPVKIPGSIPVHGKYLLDPVQDKKDDAYRWLLHHTKRYSLAEGVLANSFMDLEPGPLKYLLEAKPGMPPVYPIGPLIKMDPGVENGSECLTWLDDQPLGSVLFVSFGSGGTLSHDQLNELALGLEMSEQRFIWVVRSPNEKIANANFFSVQSQNDPFSFLPKGFVERTKGKGFVVSSWAPQAKILSHKSTGGFLTHCGWNSTLESVVNGIPLIAWPLYAEQKMNALMLADDVKVALKVKLNDKGLVERKEITNIVKSLMEGEEGKKLRYRMKTLKEAAAAVLSENGSSTKSLSELALKWKNQKRI